MFNRRFREIKEEVKTLEKILKETRKKHKADISKIEKLADKKMNDAELVEKNGRAKQEFWLKKVSNIRTLEKELTAEVAMIDISLDDASKRLARAKTHQNKFYGKIDSLNKEIEHGHKNIM